MPAAQDRQAPGSSYLIFSIKGIVSMSVSIATSNDGLSTPRHHHIGKRIAAKWQGSAVQQESSLHQLAPYIGKMKPSMAGTLISTFAKNADVIYTPFSGSGTATLQAWSMGRSVIASDLNPYAVLLTRAKIFPYLTYDEAFEEINLVAKKAQHILPQIDLRRSPYWVRSFFHPETLREILSWVAILRSRDSYFLLACLMGILHHQRPGFLSYPSSHTVPYLREKNFPRIEFPELYEYRSVRERLEKKAKRALKRMPSLDIDLYRRCYLRNATTFIPERKAGAIICSPPYMRRLTYARDN